MFALSISGALRPLNGWIFDRLVARSPIPRLSSGAVIVVRSQADLTRELLVEAVKEVHQRGALLTVPIFDSSLLDENDWKKSAPDWLRSPPGEARSAFILKWAGACDSN